MLETVSGIIGFLVIIGGLLAIPFGVVKLTSFEKDKKIVGQFFGVISLKI
ncbi:hypothetical protein [Microbulbifer sp. TRSA001]